MATTDSNRLELHVIGASQGESIVLKLPSGGWGVVDCYASSAADPSKNPTYQFLVDQDAERLAHE